MTRCPADTTFKFFINGQKVNQVKEWEVFPALDEFEKKHKDIFDRNTFFQAMQEMI